MTATGASRSPGLRGALVVAALAVGALAASPALAAEAYVRSVDVARDGDAINVSADIVAPVPPAVAWDVLTDFDNMPKFMPRVEQSRIVRREGNHLWVEQRVRRPIAILGAHESQREMDLTPTSSIKAVQTKGEAKAYESLVTFAPDGAGTKIVYRSKTVFKSTSELQIAQPWYAEEIRKSFEAAVAEMIKRKK